MYINIYIHICSTYYICCTIVRTYASFNKEGVGTSDVNNAETFIFGKKRD